MENILNNRLVKATSCLAKTLADILLSHIFSSAEKLEDDLVRTKGALHRCS